MSTVFAALGSMLLGTGYMTLGTGFAVISVVVQQGPSC
jgi:hypothetical protein